MRERTNPTFVYGIYVFRASKHYVRDLQRMMHVYVRVSLEVKCVSLKVVSTRDRYQGSSNCRKTQEFFLLNRSKLCGSLMRRLACGWASKHAKCIFWLGWHSLNDRSAVKYGYGHEHGIATATHAEGKRDLGCCDNGSCIIPLWPCFSRKYCNSSGSHIASLPKIEEGA